MTGNQEFQRHIILDGVTETEEYRSPQQGGARPNVPEQDRVSHGGVLLQQINDLLPSASEARQAQAAEGMEEGLGIQIEFESFPDIELAFESLARERSGIELLNVRNDLNVTRATVFVPDGKLDHFEGLVRDYLSEKTDSLGRARDNRRLLDAIQQIRTATLQALWTDDEELPTVEEGNLWWEVWVRSGRDWSTLLSEFRVRAETLDMRVAAGESVFPERAVLLVNASVEQMQRSLVLLNNIAELRRPKETAEFFASLEIQEQQEWLRELLSRTTFKPDSPSVPRVCLLDTGVNRGHNLLTQALDSSDLHTVEPAWGPQDADGHGTEMAGLALVGNLMEALDGNGPVEVEHRLESVKLLPQDGFTGTDRHLHGNLTVQAAAQPEVTAPFRQRVFGMAVTARDNRDRGRPSEWSAALDSLAADVAGQGTNPRLLMVSAGNTDQSEWSLYPDSNDSDGIHDPAQAWNVLTIGASTGLARIDDPTATGYQPIAAIGGLSPFSTTSLTWDRHLPLKPDIVLEGGNAAKDALSAVSMGSLSLLTTNHQPVDRLFTTTVGTSASTALASRMAAQIMAKYPTLWPETIRGLLVHSAEWTDDMKTLYLCGDHSKNSYLRLMRRCGFGVPNLSRALWSVSNSLTMVIQESLQPFRKETGGPPVNRDMHLHSLPWPQDVLQSLGATPVEMRVTLSYFIQPNPSRRGRSRYRYESHGLRFDVKRPLETIDDFRARINAAARDEEEGFLGGDLDSLWLIGKQGRHRGSLHGDIWRGSAAELASRGYIGVYPAMGWWRTRPALDRCNDYARYSLVVSIKAPETSIDLYSEVANLVGTAIPTET